MVENDYRVEQWLVRTEPPVSDHGITTNRVLVDRHELPGQALFALGFRRGFGWEKRRVAA